MDWKSLLFDWNRARAFLATAETGSLSAAARVLGTTQPTVGRQVSGLEDELGLVLFDRHDRGMVPTADGRALLAHFRDMARAASRANFAAQGRAEEVAGDITITASEVYSVKLVAPIVAKIRRLYPLLRIRLIATNDLVDVVNHEADIAVRSGSPCPGTVSRKIFEEKAYLYAAPDYLDFVGPITSPDDLAVADFVGFDNSDSVLTGLRTLGLPLSPDNFPISTGSHIVHWEMVKCGTAIGVMAARIGDNEPKVRRVLADLVPIEFPVWLSAHKEAYRTNKIKTVFDLLHGELSLG